MKKKKIDAKARRKKVLEKLRSEPVGPLAKLPDPVKLIREDRSR